MTLGILVSLIITQVWGVFENQKQRTISATAGQAGGLLALTELEQDVRSAGAGLTEVASFNCGTIESYYEAGGTQYVLQAYQGSVPMAPVEIVDGGSAAASDRIIVKRGADFLGSIPITLKNNMATKTADIELSNTSGFANGDVVLVVGKPLGPNNLRCRVTQVTQVQTATGKLEHTSGGAISYNPAAIPGSWTSDFQAEDKVTKIGQMIMRTYRINASNELALSDDSVPTSTTTSILASDIVMLKAQYGIAPAGSQTVNQWVSATVANGFDVLTMANVKLIKAVRVVIVARSAKMEVPGTTTVAPVAWPDAASPVIDLSTDPNWQRYRYRTYQLVIPIRNVIWANV
ncbi:MAG: PilW family protein [Betaproteobacteria bacterium]